MKPCPLCGQRKGKRVCPGKDGALICSACCGTKRLVEVPCPSGCEYLTGSHAASWDGRESERRTGIRRVARQVEALTESQAAVFSYLRAGIVKVSVRHRDADDALWRQALLALRRTLETRLNGLVYEHPADDWQAQSLLRDMHAVLEPPENDGRPIAEPPILIAAFKALEAAVEAAIREGSGPRAFLETATRITSRIASEEPPPPPAPSRLVTP